MEESSALSAAKDVLFTFGVVLAGGTVGGVIAQYLKVPDVAVYLIVGILMGPELMGAIDVKAGSSLNQVILIFGAAYILFDGGATLRFGVLRRVWITILIISTVGVLITGAITAAAAHWLLGVPAIIALLLGATLASTDPATLVPIFKQVAVKQRVAQTIMSESAFNDATGAIITFTVLAVAMGQGEFSIADSLLELLKQASLGVLIGTVVGGLAAIALGHPRYAFLGEFGPMVTLMAVAGAYLAADQYHASGFMAVFIFGMIIGNRDAFGLRMAEAEANRTETFVSEMALIMRLMIFVLLGSQVSFELMEKYWLEGVLIGLVFMFVARPLTVFVCALPDRRAKWSWRELVFMCWTRETGVIPAALAGMLLGLGAPGAEIIASIVFIAILMTILIQAPTTRWLADRLGLLEKEPENFALQAFMARMAAPGQACKLPPTPYEPPVRAGTPDTIHLPLDQKETSQGVRMKFGIFFELSTPRPFTTATEWAVYHNALEQCRVADELGFDHVWAVEHHFLEEYSHCSAPEVFLTAVAAQTRRIRVGHGAVVCVPEMNHPIRVAERAAALDIVSNGRLEFGTARSSTWTELGGFEVDPDDTKKTWDEFVRALPLMWTQDEFEWHGKSFSMPARNVLPKPLQKPHPPMWVTVTSPGTELDAAERGLGCLGVSAASYEEQERRTKEYHRRIRTCNPVGGLVNDQVHTMNFLYCHEDYREARRVGVPMVNAFNVANAHLYWTREAYPTRAYQTLGNAGAAMKAKRPPADDPSVAKGLPEGVGVGDPDHLVRTIKRWEAIGVTGINFLLNAMEMVSQEAVLASLRLFAREVMPQFRSAEVNRAAVYTPAAIPDVGAVAAGAR